MDNPNTQATLNRKGEGSRLDNPNTQATLNRKGEGYRMDSPNTQATLNRKGEVSRMDNPNTQAILSTRHRSNKNNACIQHNTGQNIKMMINTGSMKKQGCTQVLA